MNRHRRALRLPLAVAVLAILACLGCFGNTNTPATPKVVVDQADRVAYEGVRAFQVIEELAYHTKPPLPWPTDQQHKDINAKVSKAYQLIIDVANIGILLPPGGKLSAEDLAALSQLTTVVADIVALARSGPPAIQDAAAAAQTKAGKLVTLVQAGGVQ